MHRPAHKRGYAILPTLRTRKEDIIVDALAEAKESGKNPPQLFSTDPPQGGRVGRAASQMEQYAWRKHSARTAR